jgi:hypothetical protein
MDLKAEREARGESPETSAEAAPSDGNKDSE